MHSKSDNIEIMIYDKADEVMEELFEEEEEIRSTYQIRPETSMRGSDFIFDYVNLMHYKVHKKSLKLCRSHIDKKIS